MNCYQKIIHEIDPALNPAGVEASMRLTHGTLDHLSRAQFEDETKVASACERREPGFLERAASSFGMAEAYKRWQQRLGAQPGSADKDAP